MKYFDTFTGIGGFTIPLNEAGHECIGYSEIDKYACSVYQKHFPFHKNYGDITKINAKELPDFDILVGGFPCQSFSIAGKRGGFNDTRGTLFFEIARIIREKQPRLLLLENVKGLLSHDQGTTFYTIISTLDEMGYNCQWQVLNSKNFGVPQNRERVFIIGHLRGTSRPEVFPLGGTTRAVTFSKTIRSGGKGSLTKKHAWDLIQINKPKHSNDRVYSTKGISPTLNTMQGGNRQPFIKEEQEITRRVTPKECERLQGFPDDWTKYGRVQCKEAVGYEARKRIEISDSQRYKMCGNAVTVNVVREIIKKLI